MKKMLKIITGIVLAGILVFCGLFLYHRIQAALLPLDGPGMIYCWTDYELRESWTELGNDDGMQMEIKGKTVTVSFQDQTKQEFEWSLPDDVSEEGTPEGDVSIVLAENPVMTSLVFHKEVFEEETPILIVTMKDTGKTVYFVQYRDKEKVPEDYGKGE